MSYSNTPARGVSLQIGDVFRLTADRRIPILHKSFQFPAPVGEYLVVTARFQGGGTGHGPHDVYPNGWYVEARLLGASGEYRDNENFPYIGFYQSGCFNGIQQNIEPHRKMRCVVSWEAVP